MCNIYLVVKCQRLIDNYFFLDRIWTVYQSNHGQTHGSIKCSCPWRVGSLTENRNKRAYSLTVSHMQRGERDSRPTCTDSLILGNCEIYIPDIQSILLCIFMLWLEIFCNPCFIKHTDLLILSIYCDLSIRFQMFCIYIRAYNLTKIVLSIKDL